MAYKDPEVGKSRDRERFRKRTAERRAAGLCPRCGSRRPAAGRSLCEPCVEKRRLAERARNARLRAAGIPRRDRAKARAAERRRYRRQAAERKAGGICTRCGREPAVPDRSVCEGCLIKRREADRARYRKAKAAGLLYGGKPVAGKRRSARIASRNRRRVRRDANLCARCGRRPPVEGGATCGPCREARQAGEREIYAARSAAGLCTRCGGPTTDRTATCAPCAALEDERGRPERRNAAARRRYRERQARRQCTDCCQPAHGASRCEACAKRSYERSDFFHGIPVWDPNFTVIEIATGDTHGPFDTKAEAVAGLVFAGLEFDEVEIVNDAPVTARLTA